MNREKPGSVRLTEQEVDDIVAFLVTLLIPSTCAPAKGRRWRHGRGCGFAILSSRASAAAQRWKCGLWGRVGVTATRDERREGAVSEAAASLFVRPVLPQQVGDFGVIGAL